jgi:indolepyruvate ferredoxin oxidoreductase alpha subunit
MAGFDLLLKKAPRTEYVLGNYAFVRGMLESGVQVATCYPGSPTAEMANAMMGISGQAGVYFEISTNEKVALEIAAASSIAGRPSACWMKSVGLNVAADSAAQLSFFTMPGGLVVILGDDPGHLSSQNEQDNRLFLRAAYLPVLEPATAQEAKDYFVYGMELSQKLMMPVFIRTTTRTCHQLGRVDFEPRKTWDKAPEWDNELMLRGGGYVPLPGTLDVLKTKALKRLKEAGEEMEKSGLNRVVRIGDGKPELRVITFGHCFQSLESALEHLGRSAEVLKLAQTNPLPKQTIREFLKEPGEVWVLEELDPVLEQEIKSLAYEEGLPARVIGKRGREDEHELTLGEYHPTRMVEMVSRRLGLSPALEVAAPNIPVPQRSPTLCPGCGHRTAFYAVKKAMGKDKEAFSMADIGCYSLGYLPPFKLGNLLFCMGSGAPSASAMSMAFPDEPVISFVGDSTFYHAALPGIANAVYNGHRQVIMVMDNGVTSMTGHQPNPNSGANARGQADKLSMDEILRAMGIGFVERHPAYEVDTLVDSLKRAFEYAKSPEGGVAVVIQEEANALIVAKERIKKGALPGPLSIDHKVCRNIENCLKNFSCPAIGLDENDLSAISTDLCVGCASCVQICPMKEKPIRRIKDFKRA